MNHLTAMLHLADDTALWLVWGSVILGIFVPVSDLSPAVLLLGVGGLSADWLSSRKKWLGLLGLLPALGVAALCSSTGDALLGVPPVLYLAVCILRGETEPDPTELYYRFRVRVWLTVAGGICCILAGRLWGFRCAVVSVSAEVFLQRLLRHDPGEPGRRRLLAMELALMAAVLGCCMVLSSPLFLGAGMTLLRWVWRLLISPVLELAGYVLLGILWVLGWVLDRLFPGKVELPMQSELMQTMGGEQELFSPEPGTPNPLVQLLLRLAGAAIFLTAAWFVFRYLHRGSGKWSDGSRTGEEKVPEIFEEEEEVSRPGLLDRTPEARIRRTYAAWCRSLTRNGLRIAPVDTTRSVNRLAGQQENPDALELRRLYLQARYDPGASLTGADARRAAALSRQLRSGQ